jgi:hypothetical protein
MKLKKLIILFTVCCKLATAQVSDVGLGWAGNSVNTVVFRKNSVISHKNWQYTSYYNDAGYLVLAKRKLHTNKWEVRQSQYRGNIKDAHNSISIMIDGDGYLHVSWDQHASKLRYAKSIAPGALELGAEMVMIGRNEQKATYPEFYALKNGDLLFLYREGASGKGNLVLNRYYTKTKKWERVHDNLIDGQGKRNAYWQACIDKSGVFHISWVWREQSDVATNHDMSYAKSLDEGKTWISETGKAYPTPMNIENTAPIVLIPQKSELINSTSMTTSPSGMPYIASYWRSVNSNVPQYQIIYYNGEKWLIKQVAERKTPFTLSGVGTKRIPISRPQIVVNKKQIALVFRDEERGSKISVATTKDIEKGIWQVKDVSAESQEQWEPSYDTSLWQRKNKLQLFVQQTGQGDGEKTEHKPAQMVKIIQVDLK